METASSLDKLKGLKNEELRVILKRNGQPTSGEKCDLVLRCHMLFQKKRNENPEKIEVVEHEKPLINVVSNVKSNEGLTKDRNANGVRTYELYLLSIWYSSTNTLSSRQRNTIIRLYRLQHTKNLKHINSLKRDTLKIFRLAVQLTLYMLKQKCWHQ